MLNAIIDWSLRNRFLVLLGAFGFIVLGVFALTQIAIDAFPDITPVQVQINTVAPALGPEEVERQITFPVEQAISGLKGLTQVRSISKFGLSQVVVTFEDGIDIYFARQQILERLGTVELEEGYPRPRMGPVATGLGEVFHYVVTGQGPDATEVRTLQDWVIKPPLRTVPGTAEVNSWGGYERQYQVRIDPKRLVKYNLTFDQVTAAIRANNLNVGGGNIVQGGEMLLVQGIARTPTVEEIDHIVVTAQDGVPVLVRDVADVMVGHEIRRGAVTANGKGEVVLGLGFMLMGENPNDVTWRMKDKLDEVKKTLPAGIEVETVYDRTELVGHVIDTVRKNLFEGGLLVVAVLFVFLGNLRAGLVVAAAIPLSMLFAFAGMWRFGIAASLLSLGALDFGLVVDSSVVMVENVVRHLSHGEADRRSHLEVVRDAAVEVRKPTMFGELIIMIVYLPILTLVGVEGKLFRPMALTVIFALLGSLVLSLTLMPVLCSLLLPRRMQEREPFVVRLALRLYAPVLRAALRHRLAVVGLALAGLAAGALVARGLGSEFVPRLSEGALVVGITRLPGTSLEESVRYNTRMEKLIREAFPDEVEHVWSRVGTAEVATDPMGVELSDMFIALRPRDRWTKARSQDELVAALQEKLEGLPGQTISFSQPIELRINEMVSGVRADVAVKLFGDDLDVLVAKAAEIEEVLRGIDGAADLYTEQITGQPVLRIRVKQDQLARHGVPARTVLDLVESIGTLPLGQVYDGQFRFPLAVRLPEAQRASPQAIGDMLLPTASGGRVPLSRLADIQIVEGPSTIPREWSQRRITVQANVRGRDMGSFVAEAQRKIAERVELPKGGRYRIEWGGQFENLERAQTRLLIVVPLALALIFILLYFTYSSVRDALLIFTGVPLAAVGGVLALWLRDLPFSISAGVGFIALSGVSVLNSLVLVSQIRHLREGGQEVGPAVEQAALTRLRPVLMTALVASLGFVPMALSTGMGAEVQRPLATVVIGGVMTSTLLTLVVLPAIYAWFAPAIDREAVSPPPEHPPVISESVPAGTGEG
ncbi:MAG: CusA/CzcA family heavy metal efflux RND transporter [Gemmataceae bacterium]|nr:CusA/CzcA family heavy metal efflux RND transporter [Gemmataceae bacterium]